MVVASKDTVKSAMALVLVMVSLAAHFVFMGQELIAALQIIIYAGAIMVVFLFVVMILNVREREVAPWYMRSLHYTGAALVGVLFLLLGTGMVAFMTPVPLAEAADVAPGAKPPIIDLLTLMITKYSLPFLMTSILLLVAVIGAVVMGRRYDPETGEEYVPDPAEAA